MIKFDCGRAPGLEKRVKREPDEADRTEAKVEGSGGRWGWSSAHIGMPLPTEVREGGRASLPSQAATWEGWRVGTLPSSLLSLCRSLAALGRDPATVPLLSSR